VELVERETQLAALGEHLDAATAGAGRLVLVAGEAGVGKTSLVRAFADERAGEARFAWGTCDGLFTPEPLGPLYELSDQLGLSVHGARLEVFAATLDALGSQPTAAVFEDVHWADHATLDLLRFLGRRLERVPALLVATYRDDELGPRHPLRVVLGDVATTAHRVRLQPLSENGVRELARGTDVDRDELYRLTGGNPFFVTEVLAAGGEAVPASVRDAVLARAARLRPEARAVLDAAAVVGPRATLALLQEVQPLTALEDCLAAGVLQPDDSGVAFRHELARLAVEEAIEPARRAALHARVLGALRAGASADPARLAHHAEAAGDATAVSELAPAAAARAAALGSHREAAAQYGRALRFREALAPERLAGLLEARAYECYVTDQIADALAAQREAFDLYESSGDLLKAGDMLRRLSRLLYLDARVDEARRVARDASELLERFPGSLELALAYANRAHLAQIDLDVDGSLSWGERALALGEQLGDEQLRIDVLLTMGIGEALTGRGTTRLEQGLAQALAGGTDDFVARAYGALAFAAVRRRDWEAADTFLANGIDYARERDLDSRLLYLLGWRAAAALDRGRWDEAAADAEAVLRHPYARLSRVWALMALGTVRSRRGDPDAWTLLDEARELIRGESRQKLVPLQVVRAEAALLSGDPDRALAEAGSHPVAELVDRWIAGKLGVMRRRAGATAEPTGPLPEPFELELSGDHAAAAGAWTLLESPYDAAMALAGSDDEDDLRRSHEAFLALGARPAAALVVRRLRERGARGIPRGPRPATRAHPAGLTPRELEVARLVAEGLRNADIAGRLVISEKTVDHHVSAILGKLGVGSRSEVGDAVAALEDRELLQPR
jgi:DNA-binding CsgD family transcriptional regulator/tetratricopeptide (TPR) repeat protein